MYVYICEYAAKTVNIAAAAAAVTYEQRQIHFVSFKMNALNKLKSCTCYYHILCELSSKQKKYFVTKTK